MCGIAGYAGTPTIDAPRATLARMIARLDHRGPDGSGLHMAPGVGLAHARLAVIDVAGGKQPLRNERGDAWLVCNGEIFNHQALRADLERQGHRFRTRSDCEVIVHLYEQYGDAFVEHLNGQFAIALWDATRRRLLLVRDRTGIRPLYHVRARGCVWFASEIKALLAAVPQAALDPLGVAQALTFWGPADPDTAFEGIRSLPPGCQLAVAADGSESLTRYWDWTFPPASGPASPERPFANADHAATALRELLFDAVQRQMRADVPVAAYLSGGLDSSAIVALATRASGAPVPTFSLAFDDPEFDESPAQQAMAEFLGTRHATLRCTRSDIGRAFPKLVRHAEQPVVRTAATPLMLLAEHVRAAGYKVVLTGEGADEVFAGYDLFREAKVRRFWARQPDSQLRPRLLERLYGYLDHSPVAQPMLARAFFGRGLEHIERAVFAHAPRWTTSQRALAFLSDDMRASLGGDWDALGWYERKLPAGILEWSPLARDQYVEAKSLLAAYILPVQGDRAAMAHSIEGRYPFLDHHVIEFANRLPPHWKIRGLTEKHVLRRALAGLLPEAIRSRTKQPYRAPDSSSFFDHGRPLDYVADLLGTERLRSAGYFDPVAVGRLFEKCRRGRAIGFADNQAFVGILSTMLLDEHFVRRPAAADPGTDAPIEPVPTVTDENMPCPTP